MQQIHGDVHTYVCSTYCRWGMYVSTYVYCMHVRTCGRCITHAYVLTVLRLTIKLHFYTSETHMGVSVG